MSPRTEAASVSELWQLDVARLAAVLADWTIPELDRLVEPEAAQRYATAIAREYAAAPAEDRCPYCDHIEDEHRTPGGECIHAHCSCDQSFELLTAAPAEERGGVEKLGQ